MEKIARKGYATDIGKIMQDLIGVRIALYFSDDIEVCKQILQQSFEFDNISETTVEETVFSPERLNLVFKLPQEQINIIDPDLWTQYPVDKTFEIQIRTVFSEGWHEIEHDVRFKSCTDWSNYRDLSRSLNGIFATLETCDWAILQLLESLVYKEYKNKNWVSMLKNKFRIRLTDSELDSSIISLMNSSPDIAKSFLKIDRAALIHYLACENKRNIPLKLDNIIYIANEKWLHIPEIESITPNILRRLMNM